MCYKIYTSRVYLSDARWSHEGWLVGWLDFNVPYQHKYGYIRDEVMF